MKKLILKTMAVCVSLFFIAGQIPIAADNIASQTVSGEISSVYSYDNNFGLSGTYQSVTNNANGSVTNFFANGSVSGHGGLSNGQIDNSVFIPQSVSFFNSNGILQRTLDLVTNTVQTFDFTGQLQTSYTMIAATDFTGSTTQDWAKFMANPSNWYYYYSTINHNSDGSYSVQYSGELYDAATSAYVTIQNYAASNSMSVSDAITTLRTKWPNLTNITADSPYPFVTSSNQYDSMGRLTKVVTYGLQPGDSASVPQSELDYSYVGSTINRDMTYQYDTDASGNPLAPTAFDANGLPTNHVTLTQVELYNGNNKATVVSIKSGAPAGTIDWGGYATSSDSNYYASQEYRYNGVKLTEMDAYDSTNDHHCTQITYYDPFGRQTTVVDAITDPANKSGVARVLQQYFYNDQLNPVTFTSYDGLSSDTIVGGGLMYSITYTYGDTGSDYVAMDETFYKNGDQSKPAFAIHEDNPTAIAALTAGTDGLSFADNVVQGTLTLGGTPIASAIAPVPNGTLSLSIDSNDNFLAVIDDLQASVDAVGANTDQGKALAAVISALISQWTASGGTAVAGPTAGKYSFQNKPGEAVILGTVSIKLGVIKLPTSPLANTEYLGGAPVINKANQVTGNSPAGIFDINKFYNLFNWVRILAATLSNGTYNNPITAKLTCNYWAVDSSGNIWAFTDTVKDSKNTTIIS